MSKATGINWLILLTVISLSGATTTKNYLFKRMSKDDSVFVKTNTSENVDSSIECALYVLNSWTRTLKFPSLRSQAFKYDRVTKICEYGLVGAMAGDFDNIAALINDTGINILHGCLPKSSDLPSDTFFYLSFMDDNPQFVAHIRYNSNDSNVMERLEKVSSGSSPPDIHPFDPDLIDSQFDTQAIVDSIPFALSHTSTFPVLWNNVNKGYVQYDTSPTTLASFSIFMWHYQYQTTYYNNFLTYTIDSAHSTPHVAFGMGLAGYAKQPYAVVRPNGVQHIVNSLYLTDIKKWLYLGVVFDSTTGACTFFENGVNKKVIGNVPKDVPLYDLNSLILGKYFQANWFAWTPRASVEMYLRALEDNEAMTLYQSALTDRAGTNCGL